MTRKTVIFSIGIWVTLSVSRCSFSDTAFTFPVEIKEGWPQLHIPENNPLTKASIDLGRSLFYDTALSVDSTLSCNSCHFASFGFADPRPLSLGVEGRLGLRNSGTLTNVAFLPYFNRDGGVKTLDIFPSVPIEDHQEMGFNMLLASKRLHNNQEYMQAARNIYKRDIDGFVITRALASFLRTFISDNSRYDQYLKDHKQHPLTPSEKRGMDLFYSSKAQCSNCHDGILFSNFSFQNNGLYTSYEDKGRQRLTFAKEDEGKFRVASLRNVELTGPYMHDGSVSTLENVLKHYANHGKQHPNKNPMIDKINLTPLEQQDIIAFLKTLTDTSFTTNPAFSNPKN